MQASLGQRIQNPVLTSVIVHNDHPQVLYFIVTPFSGAADDAADDVADGAADDDLYSDFPPGIALSKLIV